MAGDAAKDGKAPDPSSAECSGWLNKCGLLSKLHSGMNTVKDATHSGMQKAREAANSETGQAIKQKAHEGMQKAKEAANSPTGQAIQREAVHAGKDVYEQHKKAALGVAHGVKNGDVNEVVRNGVPLAAEAAMGPAGAAAAIAKQKAAEVAIKHVPVQHQEQARQATELAKHGFPSPTFNGLSGIIKHEAQRQVADSVTGQQGQNRDTSKSTSR